jgi:hypothetical protein
VGLHTKMLAPGNIETNYTYSRTFFQCWAHCMGSRPWCLICEPHIVIAVSNFLKLQQAPTWNQLGYLGPVAGSKLGNGSFQQSTFVCGPSSPLVLAYFVGQSLSTLSIALFLTSN